MQPTIGRIVHYTLTPSDAEAITRQRTRSGGVLNYTQAEGDAEANLSPRAPSGGLFNQAQAGDVCPAVIVRIFGGPAVNLQVLLDGPDTYWATSRSEGEDQGNWIWPPRT